MADANIKNARVPAVDLPSVDLNANYYVRFRIVSEDKNKSSAWSPTFAVENTMSNIVTSSIDGGEYV